MIAELPEPGPTAPAAAVAAVAPEPGRVACPPEPDAAVCAPALILCVATDLPGSVPRFNRCKSELRSEAGWYRSLGFFSNARATIKSNAGGKSGFTGEAGAGCRAS